MRTRPSSNGTRDLTDPKKPRSAVVRPNYVADARLMLMLLGEGQDLVRMTRNAGWPARSIRVFAGRHGYLFTADGTPYKPPALGEQPRARLRAWSAP